MPDLFHAHRRQFLAAVCCSVMVALASTIPAAAEDSQTPPDGVRVFYTGHSFHMFVPPLVEQMVESAGIKGHQLVGTQGIGGSRVIQHWDLADDKNKAKAALTSGEVDVFTMAAHVASRHGRISDGPRSAAGAFPSASL